MARCLLWLQAMPFDDRARRLLSPEVLPVVSVPRPRRHSMPTYRMPALGDDRAAATEMLAAAPVEQPVESASADPSASTLAPTPVRDAWPVLIGMAASTVASLLWSLSLA